MADERVTGAPGASRRWLRAGDGGFLIGLAAMILAVIGSFYLLLQDKDAASRAEAAIRPAHGGDLAIATAGRAAKPVDTAAR